MIDVKWKKAFHRIVSLKELRDVSELEGMKLLQRGQRLSVQPVTEAEFNTVCELGFHDEK